MELLKNTIVVGFVAGLSLPIQAESSVPAETAPKADIQAVLEQGKARLSDNQNAQVAAGKEHQSAQQLARDYQAELKLLEGLDVYNAMLQQQLDNQQTTMDRTLNSIANVSLIERQIMPLLVRMIDALDTFIDVDVPFLRQERQGRIQKLRGLLSQSDLTLAEKTRRVFEAYQIETEYGSTIEAYKGKLDIGEQPVTVNFLRIGRLALLYQDMTGEQVGHWHVASQSWQPLTESQYRRHIQKGLRIAKEEISPELVTIPLSTPREAL